MTARLVQMAEGAGGGAATWGGTAVAGALSSWLLVAVGLDLVLTRLLVRLAIFIPKSPGLTAASSVLGGAAALVDTLVPILGLVLLVTLLLNAGRDGAASLAWRAGLLAAAAVAVGGLSLLVAPPAPLTQLLLQLLILGAVAAFLVPALLRPRVVDVAGLALAGVALAAALAAVARLFDAAGALGGASNFLPSSIGLRAAGELLFLAGGALAGAAGFVEVVRGRSRVQARWLAAAVLVGLPVVGAGVVAPASLDVLLMWSVGLSGSPGGAVYAIAAALAIAGLGTLARTRRELAVGLAIALLAGNSLSASGLTLAALLGLALAARGLAVRGVVAAHP